MKAIGGRDTKELKLSAVVRFVKYVPVQRSKSELDWSATIDQVSSPTEVPGDRDPDVVGDALKSALDLATRNLDGRTKDVTDIEQARAAVIRELTS
ncbi:hypothetical protein [Streptomyces sp. NPDC102360]|uniref:hypothetical protein n=1 Tax=Streptomyces sp. NPDC102360 TaxID=3366160 RepID=UPI0038298B39